MISTFAILVIASFQAAFIVALLVLLIATHRHGRRDSALEEDAVAALLAPSRTLMLGQDHGESLAAALRRLDPDTATRHLLAIASRLSPEQARAIAERVRSDGWVERTLAGGSSRRWWKRMEAARLLAVVFAPADRPLLARLVCDSHPAVASAATGAISGHADAALIALLIRGLSVQPDTVRLQQTRALRTHAAVATPILIAQLHADVVPDQLRALLQLAEVLGTSAALAAVIPYASHVDAEVRVVVARALRTCYMPAGVTAARELLKDSDWRVRAAAARALAGLNAVEAIPEIQAALRDESWWVRFRAALALGSLGADGERALAAAASSDDGFERDIAVVVRELSESARLELSA